MVVVAMSTLNLQTHSSIHALIWFKFTVVCDPIISLHFLSSICPCEAFCVLLRESSMMMWMTISHTTTTNKYMDFPYAHLPSTATGVSKWKFYFVTVICVLSDTIQWCWIRDITLHSVRVLDDDDDVDGNLLWKTLNCTDALFSS